MSFKDLQLIEPVLKALASEGYDTPTPVQEQAIPPILQKKDILGWAQTGTGKTAAFALPILQMLHEQQLTGEQDRSIKALILTPTRELAQQVSDSFATYGKNLRLKHLVIFGGVSQVAQVKALRQGTDILVATPGRLLDLLNQRHVSLQNIKFFVLDEADRMLDMGFIHDVKRIISRIPAKRQTLFFSATMPPPIQQLASVLLDRPVRIEVLPEIKTAELIEQSLYYVEKHNKRLLLLHLLQDKRIETALVFARTKYGADKIAKDLNRGGVRAAAIHGNKSQSARQAALHNFKTKGIRILVATDIFARGIDIDNMTHVINYELPNLPETYVHRIGRTGRAGASGSAISFCDYEEKMYLSDIQKLIKQVVPVIKGHPYDVPLMHAQAQLPSQSTAPSSGHRSGGKKRGRTFLQQRA